MSEEIEKNPLELFIERMEQILGKQELKNQEFNNFIDEIKNLMLKNQESHVEMYNRFISILNQTSQNIDSSLNDSLKQIDHRYSKLNNSIKGIDDKLNNSIENAMNSISGVELSLGERDRKALGDTQNQIKKVKSIFFILVGVTLISLVVAGITFYAASNFYKTSVLSKEEVRQNVLDDIQASQQEIYATSYFRALENERKIIEIWKNANPNDSKSYLEFRNRVIKDNEKKNIPYFETLMSDKTSDGFEMKYKKGLFD